MNNYGDVLKNLHQELKEHKLKAKIELGCGKDQMYMFVLEADSLDGYMGCHDDVAVASALADIGALAKELERMRVEQRCKDAVKTLMENGYGVTPPAELKEVV